MGTSRRSAAKALGPSWTPARPALTDAGVPIMAVSGQTSPQAPSGVGRVTKIRILTTGTSSTAGFPPCLLRLADAREEGQANYEGFPKRLAHHRDVRPDGLGDPVDLVMRSLFADQ